MRLLNGVKQFIAAAGVQIFQPGTPAATGISFTSNFYEKAHQRQLGEKDALDVFYHGTEVQPGMKVREYNGYKLYIYSWTEYNYWTTIYLALEYERYEIQR